MALIIHALIQQAYPVIQVKCFISQQKYNILQGMTCSRMQLSGGKWAGKHNLSSGTLDSVITTLYKIKHNVSKQKCELTHMYNLFMQNMCDKV